MPLEYRKDHGALTWVRNPFTRTVTYFTDIHKKRSGYGPRAPDYIRPADYQSGRRAGSLHEELERARGECAFCPGNEQLTMEEVFRVRPHDVVGAAADGEWLIRAFYNLIPRLPECCTGGKNESYVVVEDPRHFADGARHTEDLLYTALLPSTQLEAIMNAAIEVARLAYRNPAVAAVLIRKNQGRESGASQPHVHCQVIGADQPFPPVADEALRLAAEPALWNEILAFVEGEGFLVEKRDGAYLYFCPFGIFPRGYEIVLPEVRGRITEAPPQAVRVLAELLHRALAILGPLPLDYEIHDGAGVPLHAHLSARHFPYSNIGGTLNLPATMSPRAAHLSDRRG